MKNNTPKVRVVFAIVYISLALIVALVPGNAFVSFNIVTSKIIHDIQNYNHFISATDLADEMLAGEDEIILLDIRDSIQYNQYTINGALNMPMAKFSEEDNIAKLANTSAKKIIFSNGTIYSENAWMLLYLKRIENIYVLNGGINSWISEIMYPNKFDVKSFTAIELMAFEVKNGDIVGIKKSFDVKAKPKKKRHRTIRAEGGC
ncbi:MAG: rhodanese-like domain-containing protein [Marinifilaceae bacterium]|jgi:rhodanese-related sulfurtransferase|nr:rhodanese-like domain-containing protein [Marinifilaceae bacterium]